MKDVLNERKVQYFPRLIHILKQCNDHWIICAPSISYLVNLHYKASTKDKLQQKTASLKQTWTWDLSNEETNTHLVQLMEQ